MREADSRAVTGRSPELLSTIETDVHAGSQSAKEDRSRRMLWMLGADPPQKMAVTERALEFSVL